MCINIIWNSILCTYLFNLTIVNEAFISEFSAPSMVYFILFAVFEFRLFFFIIKANHTDVIADMNDFRKTLLKNYAVFCNFIQFLILDVIVFLSLYLMKYIFISSWVMVVFFSFTWIPQIITNAINSAREPLNFKYILVTSLGKIYFPVIYY